MMRKISTLLGTTKSSDFANQVLVLITITSSQSSGCRACPWILQSKFESFRRLNLNENMSLLNSLFLFKLG